MLGATSKSHCRAMAHDALWQVCFLVAVFRFFVLMQVRFLRATAALWHTTLGRCVFMSVAV
jgi:hypothetical protein